MKPRIGIVVPGLTLGGGVPAVARFVRNTILRSGAFEFEQISLSTSASDPCNVSLYSPQSWLRGTTVEQNRWETIPYTHVGAFAGELEFQRYRPRKTLGQVLAGCDLVQVVCGSPAWANAVAGLGKPIALQVATLARVERRRRDAHPRDFKGWWRKRMTHITNRMDHAALHRVDAIQVENPWMLEYVRQQIGTRDRDIDLRYAPPGIDASCFIPISGPERLRDPYILCVGRLDDPRKNVGMLLEAYAQLPAAIRQHTPLVLAGSSPPPAAFWQRADALGVREQTRCIARPDHAALLDLYQHASVFALPSDEEGFGMVLLEAMACGVPAIATRCGGPDGIITNDKDGCLVPTHDVAAMLACLLSLLHEPERNAAMGKAARLTIEKRYDERVAGEVFLDMWQRLLHKTETHRCAG